MKRSVFIACLMILVIVFQGCNAYRETTADLSDYGRWNSFTKETLQDCFLNPLPNCETVERYGTSYYCQSIQSLLGDPNFVIHLSLQIPDEVQYQKELENFTAQLDEPVVIGAVHYYLVQCSRDDVLSYLDDEVYDGMFYNFEIISANPEENTISFISAHVWDYVKDDYLLDLLQPISQFDSEVC